MKNTPPTASTTRPAAGRVVLRPTRAPFLIPAGWTPDPWDPGVTFYNRMHQTSVFDPGSAPVVGKVGHTLTMAAQRWRRIRYLLCPNKGDRHCPCKDCHSHQHYKGSPLTIFAPHQVSPPLRGTISTHYPRIDRTAKLLNRRLAYNGANIRFIFDPVTHSWQTDDSLPLFSGLWSARQLRLAAAQLLNQKITTRT